MKDVCMIKCINTLTKFFINSNISMQFLPRLYNIQQCLPMKLEKWKETLDKRALGGALLTDLSKAFDCIENDLLIARYNSHSLSFVFSYLKGATKL